MALRAIDVSRRFSGVLALDGVSMSLERGELVGLIGPNGSGKSTLLNILAGALLPTLGRVLVGDIDVTGWPAHRIARRAVARTFQNLRLFATLSVAENITVAAGVRGAARATTGELLERFELSAVRDRPAGSLAYGEQRRLEIARALATAPQYLLLDEPTAGMGEQESNAMLERLSALRMERDLALLVIDHDPALLLAFCDRMLVLDEGRLIASGSPSSVRTDPAVIEAYLGTGT